MATLADWQRDIALNTVFPALLWVTLVTKVRLAGVANWHLKSHIRNKVITLDPAVYWVVASFAILPMKELCLS